MMGFAMGSALTAWICFEGINMTIDAWQRPWSGFFDIILMPVACLFFGGMSLFIGCFSIFCFIGIFKAKSWSERPKKEEIIYQVKRYENFGNKIVYKPKGDSKDNSRSYFCFFELDGPFTKCVLVYTEIFHLNKFNDEIIDKTQIDIQKTYSIPDSEFLGFISWFETHHDRKFDPIAMYQAPNIDPFENDRFFYFPDKGQGKVIVDFYNEYIKNDKHETTDFIEVS